VAVAIVLAVVGMVIVANGLWGDQPSPSASAAADSEPAPRASSSAPGGPATTPDAEALLEPGGRVAIAATDERGGWGTITIRRREDVGGFRQISNVDLDPDAADARPMFFQNDPDSFYVVLEVVYRADRQPETYGAQDWALRIGAEANQLSPIQRGGLANDLAADLPGGNLAFGVREYSVVFAVPRTAAAETLTLMYQPTDTRGWETPLRAPAAPPAPVASVIPPLLPPEGYVSRSGMAFSVLFSAEADALFSTPDTCTNPEVGYTVTFPDDWWTNTAIGDLQACSWFAPVQFEVDELLTPPEEVAITIQTVGPTDGIGMGGQDLATVPAIGAAAGLPAIRTEQVGVGGGFFEFGTHRYTYLVGIDGALPGGDDPVHVMISATEWEIADDPTTYTVHKAVLDRMMATIRFHD
jgi:hypothetical protein